MPDSIVAVIDNHNGIGVNHTNRIIIIDISIGTPKLIEPLP